MKVFGIDFTSAPSRRKPISCLTCWLEAGVLTADTLIDWSEFAQFEAALKSPGPWIAGLDFPFGQSRRFIENIRWPIDWQAYVRHAERLGREGFRSTLNEYRKPRSFGDKEHRRETDIAAGSLSPQKLHGVPVALMFFEGAPRLIEAGVTIPHLLPGDQKRIVIEAYPGVLARSIIGRRSYKHDTKSRQTGDQRLARLDLLADLQKDDAKEVFGFTIDAPNSLCDNPMGDHLDSLLCAIQAAWAWCNRDTGFGAPKFPDPLEGWIADPQLR